LGEVLGGGTFEQIRPKAIEAEALGVTCPIIDLETLIRTKRSAGRPKDIEAIAELELLLDEYTHRTKPSQD
jgi:hypothetical protein